MKPPIERSITLITGASSGIGAEFARQIAPQVKVLILVARRLDRLEKIRDEIRAKNPKVDVQIISCDLADLQAITKMMNYIERSIGKVNILINNAGSGLFDRFELGQWQKIEEMIKVNTTALTYLTHRVVPGMIEKKAGGILNVSSVSGLTFTPGSAVYAATKHFVTGFTEALRLELSSLNIVVTQICPGPVSTEFWDNSGACLSLRFPAWMAITPQACVRASLKAFTRGRALFIPGALSWAESILMKLLPRPITRLMLLPMANEVRRLPDHR